MVTDFPPVEDKPIALPVQLEKRLAILSDPQTNAKDRFLAWKDATSIASQLSPQARTLANQKITESLRKPIADAANPSAKKVSNKPSIICVEPSFKFFSIIDIGIITGIVALFNPLIALVVGGVMGGLKMLSVSSGLMKDPEHIQPKKEFVPLVYRLSKSLGRYKHKIAMAKTALVQKLTKAFKKPDPKDGTIEPELETNSELIQTPSKPKGPFKRRAKVAAASLAVAIDRVIHKPDVQDLPAPKALHQKGRRHKSVTDIQTHHFFDSIKTTSYRDLIFFTIEGFITSRDPKDIFLH